MEIKRKPYEDFWEGGVHPDFMDGKEQRNHPTRLRVFEEAKKVGNSVLDVACDSCVDYLRFKEAGMSYTGIDITPRFIKHAKELYPGIDARVATAFDLPFPDGSYDSVYCKALLEHLPPPGEDTEGNPIGYKQVLNEMWRVARKLMMVVFYIPTNNRPQKYNYTHAGHYEQAYNTQELTNFINNLKGFKGLEIRINRLVWLVRK